MLFKGLGIFDDGFDMVELPVNSDGAGGSTLVLKDTFFGPPGFCDLSTKGWMGPNFKYEFLILFNHPHPALLTSDGSTNP